MSKRFANILGMSGCALAGFGVAVLMGLGSPAADEPEGQSIAVDAVPAVVKKAIEAHSPGATLTHAWKQNENDTAFYLVRGKAKDAEHVEFRAVESGRLVEVEHEMTADKLPADITDQVKKLAPGATILRGEKHTAIRWKVSVMEGTKKKDIVLRADGKHGVFDVPVATPAPKK